MGSTKTVLANTNANTLTANSIAIITNSFDPTLYTSYLLSILNADKICSINGYLIKVDMDNNFCSAIDATLYPNGYSDLKNNVFSNTNIITFVNSSEPALDVLSGIKNGTLTWQQYQNMLPNKGGGICFGKGASSAYAGSPVYFRDGTVLNGIVHYSRDFIHFEMGYEAYANGGTLDEDLIIVGKFQYDGVCKGSRSGFINNSGGWHIQVLVYSGGSALSTTNRKIQITPSTYSGKQGNKVSIGY